MIKTTKRRVVLAGAAIGTALLAGCANSLDVTNPNAASEPQVLASTDGIQALAVGMQQYYATTVLGTLIIDEGQTSREIAANSTFIGELILDSGGSAMDGSLADLGTVLGNEMNVMRMAENLLVQTPQLTFDAGTRSGILALAHLYKAKAIGDLTVVFEQVPIATDINERAVFHPRAEALAAALQHLDSAAALIAANPPSTVFNTKIKGTKLDLLNTINAYRARYNLFAGNYAAAVTAANAVDPKATSYYTYDSQNLNPIYVNLVQGRNWAPRDSLGTPLIETGDARLGFFLVGPPIASNPNKFAVDKLAGFYATNTTPIPMYVPGEMMLIRAEADVQLGSLSAAVQEINAVRTKKAANDPVGLGANLSAYSGAVTAPALLTEIYRQRSSELYMQALRLEDSRRLGRPGPPSSLLERNRNFWPYPNQERQNNPNTPADPSS